MFKKLFGAGGAKVPAAPPHSDERDMGTLRTAYTDWRFGNDVADVVVALERLSDRRLHLIGLRREGLVDAVGEMMINDRNVRSPWM